MASTYGRRLPTWENEDIKEIYSIVQEFGDVTRPGTWIAEVIPPLADLPTWMQWWRPAALKYQHHQSQFPWTPCVGLFPMAELCLRVRSRVVADGSPRMDEVLE